MCEREREWEMVNYSDEYTQVETEYRNIEQQKNPHKSKTIENKGITKAKKETPKEMKKNANEIAHKTECECRTHFPGAQMAQ